MPCHAMLYATPSYIAAAAVLSTTLWVSHQGLTRNNPVAKEIRSLLSRVGRIVNFRVRPSPSRACLLSALVAHANAGYRLRARDV